METLIPLSDQEEALLLLLQKVYKLQEENDQLKREIDLLKWSMTEHD